MSYSTREVSKVTGATPRQLQWWDEHKIVSPKRDGHMRSYTLAQLLKVIVLQRLRERRMSLQLMRGMMNSLRAQCREAASRLDAGLQAQLLVIGERGAIVRAETYEEAAGMVERMKDFGTIINLDCEARAAVKVRPMEKKNYASSSNTRAAHDKFSDRDQRAIAH